MENSWWALELLPDEVNQVAEENYLEGLGNKGLWSGVSVRIWLLRDLLPELRCKWDHMPESVVQILFNKCEVEKQKQIRKRQRGRERD